MKKLILLGALLLSLTFQPLAALAIAPANEIQDTIMQVVNTDADVTVRISNKTIILKGVVATQLYRERAEQVAKAYCKSVKNLIEVTDPEMIELEARIYAIDVNKSKSLGVDWGDVEVTGQGQVSKFTPGSITVGQGITDIKNAILPGVSNLAARLNLLVKNGIATVLSEPKVVTASGSVAEIRVGGQIPTPTTQTDPTNNSIIWKDYGIILYVEPRLVSNDLIITKARVEVSSVDWASNRNVVNLGAGNKMPSIQQSQTETNATLRDGECLVIGGLRYSSNVVGENKVPLLGDIPILGWLFKSQTTIRSAQEVVILISPTIQHRQALPDVDTDLQKLRDTKIEQAIEDIHPVNPGYLKEDTNETH